MDLAKTDLSTRNYARILEEFFRREKDAWVRGEYTTRQAFEKFLNYNNISQKLSQCSFPPYTKVEGSTIVETILVPREEPVCEVEITHFPKSEKSRITSMKMLDKAL